MAKIIVLPDGTKIDMDKNPYQHDWDWFKYTTTTSTTTTTTTIAPTKTNNTKKYLLYIGLGILAFMILKKKK
jgi:hypothetical protein